MSIGVYIRVSTQDQKTDSQREEITRWLEAHHHAPSSIRWFEDKESGSNLNRESFKELESAIFSGEIKTVIVWKLDRIARSMKDGINTLSSWCDKGIRVVSITQQIDLSGKVGQLVAGVLFSIAEIELEHTKERQAAGIALAKQRGVYAGRKKGTTKAKPDRARELKSQGLKEKEIANALGVTERTVFRYLKG